MRLALVILSAFLCPQLAGAESFESLSAKAAKAAKAGQTEAAIDDYGKALDLWQDGDGRTAKARVLAARARLYDKAGRQEEALADVTEALSILPKTPSYRTLRGHVELELGQLSAAITDLYRATSLDLNLREAYLDRGQAYARQGDFRFAREDYQTACRLGLKAGCERAAFVKERLASRGARRRQAENLEAMKPPEGIHIVEIRKEAPPPPRKLDLRKCRAALDACVESGLGFGDCVRQTRACPKECVEAFDKLASSGSEASAFRWVFNDGHCSANLDNR